MNLSIGSTKDVEQGIQIFAIENGKLNANVKLIRTSSGMRSSLDIEYDFFSVIDWKVRPTIHFNATKQLILLPLVSDKGKVTHQFITYKFNGHYFEKVKG